MSSHREAPEISKDPVADNTDLYAFVCPDDPNYVCIIANFIPLQIPDSGPNFWEFGEDVTYNINLVKGQASDGPDVIYSFKFDTKVRSDKTFLYNTGPIDSPTSANWNRPQTYSVRRYTKHSNEWQTLGYNLTTPPVNVGQRSTPMYAGIASQAIHKLKGGQTVFAGQRAEGFHVDLGSIFDLGTLRPFAMAHLIPSAAAVGVNGTQALNVHSIALKLPIADVIAGTAPLKGVMDPRAVVGVWASAERPRSVTIHDDGSRTSVGKNVQVSRLGNPLFNEVIIPMAYKDKWNASAPWQDKQFAQYGLYPELAGLLPVLYPGVFKNLAAYKKPRYDLAAILLTGIPAGVVPGFQNYTGPGLADMLRLNVAVPPTAFKDQKAIGLLAGDAAGFPNGRRPIDDVTAIELRAVAGLTIPLVDKSYKPDDAAALLTDGTSNTNAPYLEAFPYLGTPAGGSESTPGTPAGF